jgi:hypothetical protein
MTSKTIALKQNGKGTPAAEAKKEGTKEVKTTGQAAAKQPTVEELQKHVQELTARLNTIPRNLDERIEYFNHKKDLIRKLSRLETNASSLQSNLDMISELAAVNEYETEDFILSIEAGNKYNRKQIFSLQNPVLIGDVLTYLLGKIEAKVNELKKEIEA